jgi:hypothetical protein
MTAITLTKLARRMLLLFLLGGTLAYLKAPTKAQAGEEKITCAQCENDFTICVAKCNGDEECLQDCHIEEQGCLANCTE